MKTGTRFVLAGILIAAAALALTVALDRSQREAGAADVGLDSLLQIPAEKTVLARQEFLDAFRRVDRRHARALYEEFLPRIGANGLRESIQQAYPACHDEGHDLGKVIFAKLRDVGTALESCADACASGCMHGVLMEFFTDSGATAAGQPTGGEHPGGQHDHSARLTTEQVARRIPTMCDSPAFTRMYRPGDCAHGVGHAAMFLSSYDLDRSIALCEHFPTYPMKYYCATGAYMEYRLTRSAADYPVHGALYPCDRVPYPAACFRYVFTYTLPRLYRAGGSLDDVTEKCLALEGKYRLGCFHGIGNAHMRVVSQGRLSLDAVCSAGSRDDQTACIEGAMERLGKFSPTVAAERCEALSGWRKDVCSAATQRKMYDMDKSFALYQR